LCIDQYLTWNCYQRCTTPASSRYKTPLRGFDFIIPRVFMLERSESEHPRVGRMKNIAALVASGRYGNCRTKWHVAVNIRVTIISIMVERYNDYDPFAWLYNQHWGNMFTPVSEAVIDRLVLPRLSTETRILDLCCGTGQLADILSRRGYRVTGIDGSEKMLEYARTNAPKAEFLLDDARSFSSPDRYDAVVCMFDSLNHVMSIEELGAVFKSVYATLKPGGLFLFDLNTEVGYNFKWSGSFGIVEDDHVCVIQNSYESRDKLAVFDATLFRLEDSEWARSDFTLRQRCYMEPEIRATLEAAGLIDIQVYDVDSDTGLKSYTEETRKAFYLSHKP
jgi:SAM-dependent methyltransferase